MCKLYLPPRVRIIPFCAESLLCLSKSDGGHEGWEEETLMEPSAGGHEGWGEDPLLSPISFEGYSESSL